MKTLQNNKLAILNADCEKLPKTAISLLEIMLELNAYEIVELDGILTIFIEKLYGRPIGTLVSNAETRQILSLLKENIKDNTVKLGWLDATMRVGFLSALIENRSSLTAERVRTALEELKMAIRFELAKRKFVMIENQKATYFEKIDLFGTAVRKAVSSEIENEIVAAGNSFAVGLNTASAFHSLRAAELGMRRLCIRLGVGVFFRDKGKIQIGVDEAVWEELILGVKSKIAAEKNLTAGKRKIKRYFKEYVRLADQFDRMKNDRNNVMHTRGEISEPDAEAILLRAKDFLKELVKRKVPLK